MRHVILLSSVHMNLGKCNPSELYRIIEKLQPDVIFEELPLDIFCKIYFEGYPPRSIEAIAIKEYLRSYSIRHYPVDTLDKNLEELFDGYDVLEKASADYVEIVLRQASLVSKYGHTFINSDAGLALSEQVQELEEQILLKVNNQQLLSQYELMKKLHYMREEIMLENIYKYSKTDQYRRALFICGAEHRKSIMKMVSDKKAKGKSDLNWTCYNDEGFILAD